MALISVLYGDILVENSVVIQGTAPNILSVYVPIIHLPNSLYAIFSMLVGLVVITNWLRARKRGDYNLACRYMITKPSSHSHVLLIGFVN